MNHLKDHSGKRFGRLVFVKLAGRNEDNQIVWEVKCDCGTVKIVRAPGIVNGKTRSCGCLNLEKLRERSLRHGRYASPTHSSWSSMKQRCYNPKSPDWNHYGGRGISVCERWRNSFQLFLEDMGERPSIEYTIGRINQDGNYEPSNCRWETQLQQQNNRSSNRVLEFCGEKKTVSQWARKLGIPRHRIFNRIRAKLPIDQVLYPGFFKTGGTVESRRIYRETLVL